MIQQKQDWIGPIPTIVYGVPAERVVLFVHGKMGYKEEAESLADIVCPYGWQVLAVDLPGRGERTAEAADFVPWKVVPELQRVMAYAKQRWTTICLRANSIGAWFSMLAYAQETLANSLFVSPILDMSRLIQDMMTWAGVSEAELNERKTISTEFGETLDWEYFQYANAHPVCRWDCPTAILYAGQDNLTARDTVDGFVQQFHCTLTVMEDGEHWFHTPEQLNVLERWTREQFAGEQE
ncbi:MAG: alpha/beta hydrolase [Butyricicoccus sp.]